MSINKPYRIYVHHSTGPDTQTVAQIRDYHVRVRHYKDIGYHALVHRLPDDSVIVSPGRPETTIGAHTMGYNANSLGICCAGNYSLVEMPDDIYQALLTQLRLWMKQYKIPVSEIRIHREVGKTECCGLLFDPEKMRADL